MQCPKCKGPSAVYKTRIVGGLPRRSRICKRCKTRFGTVEVPIGLRVATADIQQRVSVTLTPNGFEISNE